MKKYLVIGNPIEHSLSPVIHNYWMKKYNLTDSIYEKRKSRRKKSKKYY
jgi:shikimate dehydrogenase